MTKKLRSEEDLSYNHSEKIREIINHQIRHKDNIEYIKSLCQESWMSIFNKIMTNAFVGISMIVVTAIITTLVNRYFEDNIIHPISVSHRSSSKTFNTDEQITSLINP